MFVGVAQNIASTNKVEIQSKIANRLNKKLTQIINESGEYTSGYYDAITLLASKIDLKDITSTREDIVSANGWVDYDIAVLYYGNKEIAENTALSKLLAEYNTFLAIQRKEADIKELEEELIPHPLSPTTNVVRKDVCKQTATTEVSSTTNPTTPPEIPILQDMLIEQNCNKFEWLGTPSELTYLMQQLAYKGDINNPVCKDGEFNNAAFHQQIAQHFTLVNGKDSSVLTYLKSPCMSSNNLFSSAIDKLPTK